MTLQRYKNLLKILPWLFFAVIVFTLYKSLNQINLEEVLEISSQLWGPVFFAALALCALDYAILSTYELISFRHLKIKLPVSKIYYAAFICYTFTLNLGSLVGGLGMRYRIYSKYHIPKKQIPFIIGCSTSTNWLGYTSLLGLTSLFDYEKLSDLTSLPIGLVIGIGSLALSLTITYFYLILTRREITIKKAVYPLPTLKTALLQLVLSLIQWCVLTSILYTLMRGLGLMMSFESLLFALLSVSVMAVFVHVPAGLGVMESVFLALRFEAPASKILAAILAFRVVYYLIPLVIATPLYFLYEITNKDKVRRAQLAAK